ncbi:uncharacterized protein EpC_35930 [Erwinia pyrifoliae Ep1/96]|nr:uncharacterized protein EpC_35930 [Erwinia pyrifoliae Ep1/96]
MSSAWRRVNLAELALTPASHHCPRNNPSLNSNRFSVPSTCGSRFRQLRMKRPKAHLFWRLKSAPLCYYCPA